ncbi:Glyoxalase/Bleomycin resistance protein/Dihydroxybiphenyl dioxygenase [Canariomyces notabilis]|uniref:Glyoxalase/Bleomycin resistance protein/Dihydroxybiphenyl dioxygenase n=1 Tax=Canariomyces notabilis TaxID=2074819 RepID=A0AAN6TPK8_9PEZI|nr:Glyoxalase/Bleomycin resistance protein/Dihydroxybiphenyl dioxygenase [Canariomyces arenarius]
MTYITNVALLVRDYDEAIAFYSKLGFQLVEDTPIPEQGKRWVTVRPPPPYPERTSAAQQSTEFSDSQGGGGGAKQEASAKPPELSPRETLILLARPSNAEQEAFIGNQTGGRVFLFLATDNFERDFKLFSEAGVEWVGPRRSEPYGEVVVWKDLYGNLWDLVQYR